MNDHVNPNELTSIAPETCTTEVAVATMKCGICKRIPTDPVMDENCEQNYCRQCVAHLEK